MFLPIGDDVDNRSLPMAGTVLIAACVLVFILQMRILFDHPRGTPPKQAVAAEMKFITTWGLVPQDLSQGTYHGLITYQFLHGDLMHLLGNMIVLWALVNSLENHLGALKLLGFYLLWGVAGGLLHALMHRGVAMPLIGASGAIAGMIGAYFVAYGGLTKIKTLYWFFGFRTLHVPTALYVFLWFMGQVASAGESLPGEGGVAWYCHIGGFVAGMVTMFPLRHRTSKHLCVDQEGRLYFASKAASDAAETEVYYEQELNCPYCDQLIEVADETITLVRCKNPTCARVIFLDPQLSGAK